MPSPEIKTSGLMGEYYILTRRGLILNSDTQGRGMEAEGKSGAWLKNWD